MKKWVKILLYILLGLILLIAILIGFGYWSFFGKYEIDENQYPHNVEYIDPSKAIYSDGFKVCNEKRIAQYYNPQRATYSLGKNGLRKFILSNYVNKGYEDSGYLNIRFVINFKGEAGRYIMHENNLDLEPQKLDDDMVNQLFGLTKQLKKWNPNYIREEYRDSYMYISYRIENGEIVEIIP